MKIIISKEELEQFIPVMASSHDVVFDAVRPTIDDIAETVCENLLGPVGVAALDSESEGCLMRAVKKYVSHQAVLAVLRQLDLVLTPTGFGVVSNDNVSPASKQRVDALEGALRTGREKAYWRLVDLLRTVNDWGNQPLAVGIVEYLYDGVCFFFGDGHLQRTYIDWEAARQAVMEADEYLRVRIGNELMDDMIAGYRTNSERYQACLPAVSLVRKITGLWISRGRDSIDFPLRRLIQVIEKDRSLYSLYFTSSAYEFNHHETFQNTKDSAAFVFNG